MKKLNINGLTKSLLNAVIASIMTLGMFSVSQATDLAKNDKCAKCHVDQASDYEESVHYINRSVYRQVVQIAMLVKNTKIVKAKILK